MLSGAMEKVAEQDIAPDTKILRLIETHLDSIKMVVFRNGTLLLKYVYNVRLPFREACAISFIVVLSTPMRANNCLATSTNISRVLETVIGIVLHILIKTVRKVPKKDWF